MSERRTGAVDRLRHEIKEGRERMLAFGELAAEATDPVVAVVAKSYEIQDARQLGLQQHAVVAGTELLSLYERLEAGDHEEVDHVPWGFKYAVGAALDIPEIPLTAVDELMRMLERVLSDLNKQPYAVWQLEARRHHIEGDGEAVRERVERLLPHVNRTNHVRNDLDCPGCSRAAFARYLGPSADVEAIHEILEPTLSGRRTYNNEDPSFDRILNLLYGERESCASAVFDSHSLYALRLVAAGRAPEARQHADKSLRALRESGIEASVWPLVARVEVARALRSPELRPAVDDLARKLQTHEDANEAVDAAVCAWHGLRAAGAPAGELAAMERRALDTARRLDARIPHPRHVAAVRASLDQRSGS